MRILDVNNSYSPVGGGIRVYEHRKMDHFSRTGEHSFALAAPHIDPGKVSLSGATVYHCDSVPLLDSGYRVSLSSGPFLSAINDFRPDIIEIGSPWVLPSIVRRVIGSDSIATVGFFHTNYPESYIRPLAERLLPPGVARFLFDLSVRSVYRTYSRMDAVFCASRKLLDGLHRAGLRRLFHTPLGVDAEVFAPSRRSQAFRAGLGAGDSRKLVLYLARLHSEKGIDLLMEAYPLFRDPSSIVLAIGGHGPAEGRVREFTARYPEVRRIGYLDGRHAMAEAMASSDVFLSLGPFETFGLAGREAMASGTSTLFPDIGAGAEMAALAGVLPPYEHRSAESLSDGIKRAIALDREQTSQELRDCAKGMDWTTVFRREEKFYRIVLDAVQRNALDALIPTERWWEY